MPNSTHYTLTTATGIAIVVASMIGTGAFTSLGFQLVDLQNPAAVLTLWLVGGALALCGALSYAEVGTAIKRSGGEYAFLSEMYHPLLGYLSGWLSLTVGFAAPIALSAIAFTAYFPIGGLNAKWLALMLLALITVVHTRNLATSSRFQVGTTLFKVLVLVVIIVSGLLLPGGSGNSLGTGQTYCSEITSSAFAVALIYASYSYSGWNAAAYVSTEFKDPARALPVALVGGTVIVTVLYTLLQFVFLKHAPIADMVGQLNVGEIALSRMLGTGAGELFGIIISVLLISSISAMVWVGPRVTASMAEHHTLWRYFGTPAQQVPKAAIWLQFFISALLIATGTFDRILIYCGFLLTLSSLLVVLSVFILRRRNKAGTPGAFRSPFFPIPQVVFAVLSVWMIAYAAVDHPRETLIGLSNLGLGLVTYFLGVRATTPRTIGGQEQRSASPW